MTRLKFAHTAHVLKSSSILSNSGAGNFEIYVAEDLLSHIATDAHLHSQGRLHEVGAAGFIGDGINA